MDITGNENRGRITVSCEGHTFFYPISDILRLFTGKIPKESDGQVVCEGNEGDPDITVISRVEEDIVETTIKGTEERIFSKREGLLLPLNREVKRQLYFLLSGHFQKTFPWGSLTGIRPTQVARELSEEKEMTEIYGVREDKAHLAFLTKVNEDRILNASDPSALHVYIGIPFCPSRCSYCSFVAQEAPRKTALLPSYIDSVLSEMELVLPNIKASVETLYIGGGTPTVLPEDLFEKFISGVFSHPEFSHLSEVCVEAGRPDTITEKKLSVLLDHDVRRICINPQTLCDETLVRVGRKHSAQDFLDTYSMAKKMGFSVINTDLIAGLPEETYEEFCDSLCRIIELSPENITVHSQSK